MIKECVMCLFFLVGLAGTGSGSGVGSGSVGTSPPLQPYEHLTLMVLQEASGESFLGQVAVAGVAIDRMKDSRWPNTIKKVVYQSEQFKGMDKLRNHSPDEIALARKAVAWAWRGFRPCGQAAYWFHNISIHKPKTWISVVFRCRINSHIFYGEKYD